VDVPVYQKIENEIKESIRLGKLKSGDLLPSENVLKEQYNVSRMTVRQALNNLVNEGYVYRHKGKGTFVQQQKIDKLIHGVRSFTEEMMSTNRTVKNKIIRFEVIQANSELAEKLFLQEGDEVFAIERVRYGGEIPVLFEELFVPKQIFRNLEKDVFKGSFYKFVESQNYKISHCIQIIEVKKADEKKADYLKIEKSDSVLKITRNTFLNNGRPFEYVRSSYRADQYRFIQYAFKG